MTLQHIYGADGISDSFAFSFPIDQEADVQVLIDGIDQSSGFTIRGVASPSGGVVVFYAPPAMGKTVAIRHRGRSAVSSADASNGYLADKLAAGDGIAMTAATGPDGVQTLVISAEAGFLSGSATAEDARAALDVYSTAETDAAIAASSDLDLKKAQNLADLADAAAARTNLGVYAKTETYTQGETNAAIAASSDLDLKKAQNLADVPNKLAARANLDVYSVTETNNAVAASTATALLKAENLLDVPNKTTARANLEVYSITQTNDAVAAASGAALQKSENLGDLPSVETARTNLGLDDVAYLNQAQDWTQPQRNQAVSAASAGGSTVLDMASYQNFDLTLTADITFADPAIVAAMVGQRGTIGIVPAGFAIAGMGSVWKRVGDVGAPSEITGLGRIDYHIRAIDRIEYAYNDVEV